MPSRVAVSLTTAPHGGGKMKSPAQPFSTPPQSPAFWKRHRSTGVTTDEKATTSDSVSVAKLSMIGTLGAALITAAVPIVSSITSNDGGVESMPVTQVQESDRGSIDHVAVSDSGTKVTVSGWANPTVESVGVMIGPPEAKEPIGAGLSTVSDGKWSMVVTTEPHIPSPYEIKAFYRVRTVHAAGIHKASHIAFPLVQPPPAPAPPTPGQEATCAVEFGDSCFTGPGWGSPSIYRSDQ
jgi:hypothetical protein